MSQTLAEQFINQFQFWFGPLPPEIPDAIGSDFELPRCQWLDALPTAGQHFRGFLHWDEQCVPVKLDLTRHVADHVVAVHEQGYGSFAIPFPDSDLAWERTAHHRVR